VSWHFLAIRFGRALDPNDRFVLAIPDPKRPLSALLHHFAGAATAELPRDRIQPR
jgi:hypothetical protein